MRLPFFQFRPASALVGLGLALTLAPSLAIEVVNESTPLHQRFDNDASFIGAAYDWSGVGTTASGRWVTMIDDQYFIAAEHFRPGDGNTVRFFHTNDAGGGFEDRVVDAGFGMEVGPAGSDIWLGKLTTPVSANVTSYDILDLGPPGSYSNYEGLSLFTVGIADGSGHTNFRLGTNIIDASSVALRNTTGIGGVVNNWSYTFTYDVAAGTGESTVEVGDSGAPSFAVDGGAIKLVGIHSERSDAFPAGPSNGDVSHDSLVGAYAGDVIAAVPEPSSAALLVIAAGVGIFRRRRRLC